MVDLIAANGKEAQVIQRIIWVLIEGAVAIALLDSSLPDPASVRGASSFVAHGSLCRGTADAHRFKVADTKEPFGTVHCIGSHDECDFLIQYFDVRNRYASLFLAALGC